MARKQHRRLFEELGLLDQPPASNPYETLGLDPNFASEILKEKDGLATLRAATTALHRVLAKRYHPDVTETGNEQRFHDISQANESIEGADKATLIRWSRKEQQVDRSAIKRAQSERQQLVQDFTELFQDNLELGNHPDHFSQLAWAQGLLLQRANIPYLLLSSPDGGVKIVRGHTGQELGMNPNALSLPRFLRQHDSFGLEPGEVVRVYVTSERASIVDRELRFIMDITDPIADYRKRRTPKSAPTDSSDLWARANDPLLISTTVPDKKSALQDSASQMIVFPNGSESTDWSLPLEAVGVLQNPKVFNRIRHGRNQNTEALTSGQKQRSTYFNMATAPMQQLIESDSQYSPLLSKKGSLVLYDIENRMPIITDVSVIGMIGSNSRAA